MDCGDLSRHVRIDKFLDLAGSISTNKLNEQVKGMCGILVKPLGAALYLVTFKHFGKNNH